MAETPGATFLPGSATARWRHGGRTPAPWLATEPEQLMLALAPALPGLHLDAAHLHLSTAELHLTVPALLDFLRQRDAALSQLGTHSATLEDVFVTLTGRQLRDE